MKQRLRLRLRKSDLRKKQKRSAYVKSKRLQLLKKKIKTKRRLRTTEKTT